MDAAKRAELRHEALDAIGAVSSAALSKEFPPPDEALYERGFAALAAFDEDWAYLCAARLECMRRFQRLASGSVADLRESQEAMMAAAREYRVGD